jgi:parvulin-like peptidyl-prolyl isomerase
VLRDEVHVRHILIKPSEIRSEAATKELAEKLYDRIRAAKTSPPWPRASRKTRARRSTAAT